MMKRNKAYSPKMPSTPPSPNLRELEVLRMSIERVVPEERSSVGLYGSEHISIADFDLELADDVKRFCDDPVGFVQFVFPWGEPGPLENFSGPDTCKKNF